MESTRMETRGYYGLVAALRPDGEASCICPHCKEEGGPPESYTYFRLMPSGLCQRHDELQGRQVSSKQKEDQGKLDKAKYLEACGLWQHWKLIEGMIKEATKTEQQID